MRRARLVVFFAMVVAAIVAFGSDTRFSFLTIGGDGVASPDGKFLVRDFKDTADSSGFVRNQRSLVLEERASGQSWKLCDHMGQISVAWASENLLVVNDFFTARGARTLVFQADGKATHVLINANTLATLIPDEIATHLTANDHVFVQAYKLDGKLLGLRAWGFGALDPKGFKLVCDYNLDSGTAVCRSEAAK
jgi:hypothetical protein